MMKKSIGASIFGALATLLVLLPTPAAAQCNCSLSTLIGTQANVRVVDPAGNGGPTVGPATVGSGVEFPGAGPALGLAGPPPRMNINYAANTIRVDFVGSGGQTYGGAIRFRFGNLHPAPPAGCSGPVTVSGIQVQTNKPGAGFVTAGAAFGPDSVTVPFAPPTGTTDWLPGQWINVTLTYACAPPPPAVGFNPCCPPWNSTQLQSMLFYQGTGGIGAPYTLRFNPTPQLHAQMNAYMNYLHTLGMGFTTILVNFQLSDAGTGASPVPGTVIINQPVVWSGTGTPTPNFFASGLMSVNRWYRIQTTIILAGPNGNTFLPRECLISFVDVRIQLMASARSSESVPATLQFRLADGRILEQSIAR
jgi:hypothetical protein